MEKHTTVFDIKSINDISSVIKFIKPGDFVKGLTYPQLLKVEEKLRTNAKNVRVMFTSNGYGFISTEWE